MVLDIERINSATRNAAKIFEAMGWTWSVRNRMRVTGYIPDVLDIRESLIKLSKDVGGNTVCAETGRLVARLIDNGEETYIRYYVSL